MALPIIWVHGLVVALAAVPFLRRRARERRSTDPVGARSRFIPIRQLLGRDPAGSAAAGAQLGPRFVAISAATLAVALLLLAIAGPLIHTTLVSASTSITLASP